MLQRYQLTKSYRVNIRDSSAEINCDKVIDGSYNDQDVIHTLASYIYS